MKGSSCTSGWRLWLTGGLWLLALAVTGAEAGPQGFEAANNLYFEGKFAEAAQAYEALLATGTASAGLYYNLGNSYFKAGQNGRAIVAYLRAKRLAPRDPNLRFNLKFVREKVTGSDAPVGTPWQRALTALTLNEWAVLGAAVFWSWFILLIVRELRPGWRNSMRVYVALAGGLTGFCAILLVAAWRLAQADTAVVVQPEVVVRQGPLERSPVAFKLRDGTEVVVQDQQATSDSAQPQVWRRIQDPAGRVGWVKRDDVTRTQESARESP